MYKHITRLHLLRNGWIGSNDQISSILKAANVFLKLENTRQYSIENNFLNPRPNHVFILNKNNVIFNMV